MTQSLCAFLRETYGMSWSTNECARRDIDVSGGLQELTGGIGLSGQDYFLEVALICL